MQDLMENGPMFSRIMEEHGSLEHQEAASDDEAEEKEDIDESKVVAPAPEKAVPALMQEEERLTGAVSWSIYSKYFRFAGGIYVFPMILLWIALSQGAQGV